MTLWEAVKNLNWRDIKIIDVIEGCTEAYKIDWNSPANDKERIKKVALSRMQHCAICTMNSNGWCDNTGTKKIKNVETGQEVIGCGCNLQCKVALLRENCPASIWKAVS